jgi:hypothetical protein
MFKRPIRTLTIAAAAGVAAIAPAASAAAVAVGPQQYFTGSVNTHTDSAVIDVLCAGPASFGHPVANQTVGIRLLLPPTSATVGYTGLSATSIDAWLSWPSPSVIPSPVAVAKFAGYTTAPIPTTITVPCSGSGVMTFVPNPDNGGRPATVKVSFINLGV